MLLLFVVDCLHVLSSTITFPKPLVTAHGTGGTWDKRTCKTGQDGMVRWEEKGEKKKKMQREAKLDGEVLSMPSPLSPGGKFSFSWSN